MSKVELSLVWDPETKSLQVRGVTDEVACLGLLEYASLLIRDRIVGAVKGKSNGGVAGVQLFPANTIPRT